MAKLQARWSVSFPFKYLNIYGGGIPWHRTLACSLIQHPVWECRVEQGYKSLNLALPVQPSGSESGTDLGGDTDSDDLVEHGAELKFCVGDATVPPSRGSASGPVIIVHVVSDSGGSPSTTQKAVGCGPFMSGSGWFCLWPRVHACLGRLFTSFG